MRKKIRKREYSTYQMKKGEAHPEWLVLDAKGKTLGRFASEISKILRGKHRPTFTPHINCGDAVIVVNADQIRLTGSKESTKMYCYHTGFQGGLRKIDYRTMKEKKPDFPLRNAVKKMMPRTRLGREQLKRLRIFAGSEHGMEAQNPTTVNV